MAFEVVSPIQHCLGRVLEKANRLIAGAAEHPSDCSRVVVMIYVRRLGLAADCAQASLGRDHHFDFHDP
jgi:hypothetical protein